MKLVLLGAPGSGKGTQAEIISQRLRIPHISTGDMLREAVRRKTPLGVEAGPIMDKGGLVPDDLMVGIVTERLSKEDTDQGFVLDGFPRTVQQAEQLDAFLEGNGPEPLCVVNLLVPDEVIVRRIASRLSCPTCGAIYHLENTPPRVAGVCDRCLQKLKTRVDDDENLVRHRLEEFRKKTRPVVDHYADKGWLKVVDGLGPIDEVFERIIQSMKQPIAG
jgi:adenylate kinase